MQSGGAEQMPKPPNHFYDSGKIRCQKTRIRWCVEILKTSFYYLLKKKIENNNNKLLEHNMYFNSNFMASKKIQMISLAIHSEYLCFQLDNLETEPY